MKQASGPTESRKHPRMYAAAAAFLVVLWLFMMVAESWTPLHAWMHGGVIPGNDDCPAAAMGHGAVGAASFQATVPNPIVWIEISQRIELSIFQPNVASLPCGRAPPVLPSAS